MSTTSDAMYAILERANLLSIDLTGFQIKEVWEMYWENEECGTIRPYPIGTTSDEKVLAAFTRAYIHAREDSRVRKCLVLTNGTIHIRLNSLEMSRGLKTKDLEKMADRFQTD